MTDTLTRTETPAIVLHLRPALELDDRQFADLARQNPDLRLERTAEGDVRVMAPTGGETGHRNAGITAQLWTWAVRDGTGAAFDSSTGFTRPNGATRSPNAAWVVAARLRALTPEERERFLPLCPDFVIELRSPSDSLAATQAKLEEYRANGARLGWLLDVLNRRASIYRPNAPVEQLDAPAALSAVPVLPGFTLDLTLVWGTPFQKNEGGVGLGEGKGDSAKERHREYGRGGGPAGSDGWQERRGTRRLASCCGSVPRAMAGD